MKKCPKCGSTYTDDFIYCDQDGAPLSVRSSKAIWIVLAVVVLVLVAAGFAAVPLLDAYVMSRMSFKVLDASLHVDPDHSVSALESVSANIVVQVKNDSVVSPSMRSMKLTCSGSGQRFADIVWPSAGEPPVPLPAGDTTKVNVRLQAAKGASGLDLLLLAMKKTLTSDCQGNAEVSLYGLPLTKKISFEEKLW
jgi:hypothetical protein